MTEPDRVRPGPLPAIIGGVLAAIILVWLVGLVVGTIVLLVRVAVLIAVVAGGLWLWNTLTGDD